MCIRDREIVTRGFIYEKESEDLIEEMKRVIFESLESCRHQRITDWAGIKNKAVSYTHLDVYKRQMYECALSAGLTSSGADAYLLHVTTTPSVSYICLLYTSRCV